MAYRYQGTNDGIEHWDGHVVVVEREGYDEPHPDDLWHWSIEHPPTCEIDPEPGPYGFHWHRCVFDTNDPCWEGPYDIEWPPGLPKIDGATHAVGTRLDVYRHWEFGDEVDFWWLVGPPLTAAVSA